MRIKETEHTTVIIIGAGATRGAYEGIGREKIHPPLNADFFHVASQFVQTSEGSRYAKAFERLDAFVQKEMLLRSTDTFTMEQIFNVLFISRDLPAVFSKGGRHRKGGHRKEIEDFFRLVVGLLRYVQENPRHPKNIDHYAKVASMLQSGDTVVSLNYDTLLDIALLNAGWDPRTGYGFSATHKIKGTLKRPFKFDDLKLLKPHGSLNWSAKGTLRNYDKVLTKRPPSLVRVDPVPPAVYEIAKARLVRFFIPPLYSKFFANKFWAGLWDETFRRVKKAEALIVIGCSLIETDFHLRAIIGRAISSRKDEFEQITLVEPNAEVVRKLKSFFRGHSARGFKTFSTFTDFIVASR